MFTPDTAQQYDGQVTPQEKGVRAELMELYPYVRSYVRWRIGDIPEWEDVVQEVFCTSLLSLTKGYYKGESSVKTWVYRIMLRRITDCHRGDYRLKEYLFLEGFDCSSEIPSFEEIYEGRDLQEKFIQKFVESFRARQFLRLLLSGWSRGEISEVLGIGCRVIDNHMQKTKKILRHKRGEINEFMG